MDIEDINDKIRIEQLKFNLEDSSDRRNKIMIQLKILRLQKSIQTIQSQIDDLKNRY